MKLLTIIFIAAISISSVLPSSGDETVHTCPAGHRKEGTNCRQILNRLHCPVATGSSQGDRCVVESKYCPLNYHLLDDNETCERNEKYPGKCRCDKDYMFDTDSGLCKKFIKYRAVWMMCDYYESIVDGKCIGLPRPARTVCLNEDGNLPVGCLPMRYERRHKYDCNHTAAEPDPEDPNSCIHVPGSLWCPLNFHLNKETNMCIYKDNKKRTPYARCIGSEVYRDRNQCIVFANKLPECTCSASSSTTTGGSKKSLEKPILACFEGTLDGGVCAITRNVQPVLGCPNGFSTDSTGTLCESNYTFVVGSSANAIAVTSSVLVIVFFTLSFWQL